jgi:hypothetical protein
LLPWLLKETAKNAVCFMLEDDPPVSDDQMAELLMNAFRYVKDDDERSSTVNWAFTHWKEGGRKLPLHQLIRTAKLWSKAGLDFSGIQPHHGSEGRGTRRMQARDPLSRASQLKHGVRLQSIEEPRNDIDDDETFGDTLVNRRIAPDEEARIHLDWAPVFAHLTPEEQSYAVHLATAAKQERIKGQREAKPMDNRKRIAIRQKLANAIQLEMPDYVKGLRGESRAEALLNLVLI